MIQVTKIRTCIESMMDKGYKEFALFPFGEVGIRVKEVLMQCYKIEPSYIFDNKLCNYNKDIYSTSDYELLKKIGGGGCCMVLCTEDPIFSEELRSVISEYIPDECMLVFSEYKEFKYKTKIGKYTYGALAIDHECIESIGSFCSFATGVTLAGNHALNYISTHPFLTHKEWDNGHGHKARFSKDCPLVVENSPFKRMRIGNDVWIGRNVIIIPPVNIGNGVIVGAGSVVTKDIPDYAVVVGAPAKIIKYRVKPEQITAMNRIAWWDWDDDKIINYYQDFKLSFEEFIKKHDIR